MEMNRDEKNKSEAEPSWKKIKMNEEVAGSSSGTFTDTKLNVSSGSGIASYKTKAKDIINKPGNEAFVCCLSI